MPQATPGRRSKRARVGAGKKRSKAKKRTAAPRGAARARRAASAPAGAAPVQPELRRRARRVLACLKKLYPDADCALRHRSAYQLLVATILSAQSTDTNVNKVTPDLFRRYPTPRALAEAEISELEERIRSTGFFRQKAKSIRGAAQRIVAEHGGRVPATMEALTALPGVARKTANVVLGTWFAKNEGIVVDTHVGRLAHRWGITWTSRDAKDAPRIEQDLVQVLPRRDWTFFSHAAIRHGRRVCTARRPDCDACELASHCPAAFRFAPA